MSGWQSLPLLEVLVDAKPGFACGEDPSDGVFQFRMNNVTTEGQLDLSKKRRVPRDTRNIDAYLVEPGDVLFNATNSPELVGKSAFFAGNQEPSVFSNHFLRLRPNGEKLDGRFLARWLTLQFQRKVFQSMCRQWVNQATVGRESLLALRIPLPPLMEQRRIAALLDQAEGLRIKRRVALAQLKTLSQAIFLDLFGDPVTNPMGWTRVPFGELLTNIDSGWSPTCLDRPVTDDEWGVLKLGAVTWCEYDADENKALPPNVVPDPELEVKPGDLLFTRKNTYELVAACALVRATPPRLMMSDLIFRFRLRPDANLDACFLHQLLIYPTKRREVQKLAGGSAGSMPNISKARLETLPIEVPSHSVQEDFAHRVAAVEKLKTSYRASLAEMDALFVVLQNRAFQGEL